MYAYDEYAINIYLRKVYMYNVQFSNMITNMNILYDLEDSEFPAKFRQRYIYIFLPTFRKKCSFCLVNRFRCGEVLMRKSFLGFPNILCMLNTTVQIDL